MTDHLPFLRSICDNPSDHVLRGAFADYLAETGHPLERLVREGEFVPLSRRINAQGRKYLGGFGHPGYNPGKEVTTVSAEVLPASDQTQLTVEHYPWGDGEKYHFTKAFSPHRSPGTPLAVAGGRGAGDE